MTTRPSIPTGTRIGHVHLKVADLDRAVDFDRWESRGGESPRPGRPGSTMLNDPTTDRYLPTLAAYT